MRKYNILAAALCLLSIGFSVTSCSDDDEVTVPENWVTLSSQTLSIDYQGGTLTSGYTLADGLDSRVVYIINHETWCSGYIDNGQIKVDVAESADINGRSATMDLVYDDSHKVTMTLSQGKAPVVLVTGIDASGMPESINIKETLDLNSVITALPGKASYPTLKFTLADGSENYASLTEDGMLTGVAVGTVTVNVAATDEGGFTDAVTLKIAGNIKYDRSDWTVTTSQLYYNGNNYVTDGSTGKPEHILDGQQGTYLSMTKPGKTYGSYKPSSTDLYFVVDMKQAQTFNYFYWQHRKQNNGYWQILSVNIYGSNDGTTFTSIKENVEITADVYDIQTMELPESTYRYVKVQYVTFSSGGSNAQVAEFGLGLEL